MKPDLYVTNRKEWRAWLKKNHTGRAEIWLVYYKKHTGKPRIPYEDAVEEALCFGWIDGMVKRIDDERYMQRFTPRKPKSNWSEPNKKRAEKLIRQKKMTKAGMEKIESAKKNGLWGKTVDAKIEFDFPPELERALAGNKKAKTFFKSLSASCQKQYIGWIASAKKEQTREQRAKEAIRLLNKNKKLGMK